MTRLSATGSRPEFLPLSAPEPRPNPSRGETAHVGPPARIVARALAFGLEDRNDRKFGDTRGL